MLLKVIIVNNVWFCHYLFFDHGFRCQDSVCNGCHDLPLLCLNISDIVITTVKGANYRCTVHDINKSEAIHLLENSVLDDPWYI